LPRGARSTRTPRVRANLSRRDLVPGPCRSSGGTHGHRHRTRLLIDGGRGLSERLRRLDDRLRPRRRGHCSPGRPGFRARTAARGGQVFRTPSPFAPAGGHVEAPVCPRCAASTSRATRRSRQATRCADSARPRCPTARRGAPRTSARSRHARIGRPRQPAAGEGDRAWRRGGRSRPKRLAGERRWEVQASGRRGHASAGAARIPGERSGPAQHPGMSDVRRRTRRPRGVSVGGRRHPPRGDHRTR
jgi:hypothetical protein